MPSEAISSVAARRIRSLASGPSGRRALASSTVPALGRPATTGPLGGDTDRGARVRQDRLGSIPAVEADDAARRMSRCPAEVETRKRGAGAETPLPHLIGRDFALEDVAPRQPDPPLDVGRPQHLVVDQAVWKIGREARDQIDELLGDVVAPGVPVAIAD